LGADVLGWGWVAGMACMTGIMAVCLVSFGAASVGRTVVRAGMRVTLLVMLAGVVKAIQGEHLLYLCVSIVGVSRKIYQDQLYPPWSVCA
jgi:hypothetical protein